MFTSESDDKLSSAGEYEPPKPAALPALQKIDEAGRNENIARRSETLCNSAGNLELSSRFNKLND